MLAAFDIELTPINRPITYLIKLVVRSLKTTKRHVEAILVCQTLTVPPEQRVQLMHIRNFVAMAHERHIKRRSRTDSSCTPQPHRRPALLSCANVCFMTHNPTIDHRPTMPIREHSRKQACINDRPWRKQYSDTVQLSMSAAKSNVLHNTVLLTKAATSSPSAIERYPNPPDCIPPDISCLNDVRNN